jgi:5-methylcytosine-specific restriction protein A
MPSKPKVPCKYPLCPEVIEPGQRYCEKHKQNKNSYDNYRGNANERGYNYRWQKASASFLIRHPLCAECLRKGIVTAATVVDHIKPHRGDYELFWDEDNWQSSCKKHHDIKTGKGQ